MRVMLDINILISAGLFKNSRLSVLTIKISNESRLKTFI